MPEHLDLEKQLKLVSKTGTYVVGRREVSNSLKGSKLLVWSASANLPQNILDEARNLSVPAIKFAGNPVELGRACGIPFRVSVIALKSTGDADLTPFTKSSDYHSGVIVAEPKQEPRMEAKSKDETEAKPKRETKKKDSEEKPKKASKKSAAGDEEKKSRKKADPEKTVSKKDADEEPKQKKVAKKKKKSDDEEEE